MDITESSKHLIDQDFRRRPEIDPISLEEFCIKFAQTKLEPDWAKKWNPDSHSNISIYDPATRTLNSRFITEVMTAYANATTGTDPQIRQEMHETFQVSLSHMVRSLRVQAILLDLKKRAEVNGALLSEFWNSHYSHSVGKFIRSNDIFVNAIGHYKLDEQSTVQLLEFASSLKSISTSNPVKTTNTELATASYTENRLQELLKPITEFADNSAMSTDKGKRLLAKTLVQACTDFIKDTYDRSFEHLNYMRRTVINEPGSYDTRIYAAMEKQILQRIGEMHSTVEAGKMNLKKIGVSPAIVDFLASRFDKVDELFYEITSGSKEFIDMFRKPEV